MDSVPVFTVLDDMIACGVNNSDLFDSQSQENIFMVIFFIHI